MTGLSGYREDENVGRTKTVAVVVVLLLVGLTGIAHGTSCNTGTLFSSPALHAEPPRSNPPTLRVGAGRARFYKEGEKVGVMQGIGRCAGLKCEIEEGG
jgi:hypothetical protein